MKKVSVVVPTLNRRRDLKKCLQSIFMQDYCDFEVIVVDNGSSDGTLKMLAEQFPKVRIIKNARNLGAAEAKNQGVSAARGEFVWFLDSDSQAKSGECMRNMVRILEEHADVGSVGGESHEGVGPVALNVGANGRTVLTPVEKPSMLECGYLATCNMMCRKKLLKEVGGFDSRYFYLAEDKEVGFRIRCMGLRNVMDEGTLAQHNWSQASRLNTFFRLHKNRLRFVLKNMHASSVLMLPILDACYLLNPARLKDFDKKRRGMHQVDRRLRTSSSPLKVGLLLLAGLISAYAATLIQLPQIFIDMASKPNYLVE